MRVVLVLVVILLGAGNNQLCAQKSDWQSVQIIDYTFSDTLDMGDTLEICGGEWFISSKATRPGELTEREVERIKKKVSKYGCSHVFVDFERYYSIPHGKLYILGVKSKG